MSFTKNILPVPVLWPMDGVAGLLSGFLPIRFQFIPDSFTRNIGSDYAEASSLNRDHPILQFTKGQLESFSFEAKLFSQSVFQEVNTLLALLIRATRRDETLKRPPLWMFIWGSAVQETVVIKSLGGIKYGPLRPDGLIRDVTLSIELARYEPFDVNLTDINKQDTSLLRKVMKAATTWEAVALATYGQAILGAVLSQRQGQATPVGGQTVALPSKSEMARATLQPKSPPLQRTEDGIAAVATLFKTRNAKVKSSSVIAR